jgi:transposase
MTVPGVGAVVALTFRATVDVPSSFASSKAVGAVFGLTPRQHQSGEVNRMGYISKCSDAMMRTMLFEAAQVMLTRTTKWSWLKAWGMKVETGPPEAHQPKIALDQADRQTADRLVRRGAAP